MTIGARLKQWRTYKNLKQDQASALLRVSFSTYQKYEMDISKPGAIAIESFMDGGISANWLLTGKGAKLLDDVGTAAASPTAAPPSEINMALLQMAIETIEDALDDDDSTMKPKHKAECVKLAYLILEEENKEQDQSAFKHAQKIIKRLIRSMN
jgi:transcriptional regulator with XRE-family HTH domain